MSDNVIEIRITGAVDSSLSSAVSEAKATIGTIGDQTGTAAAAISATLKAVGDDIGRLTSQLSALGSAAATAGAGVTSGLSTAEQAARNLGSTATTSGTRVASGLKTAEDATHSLHFATAGAIQDYFRLGQAAASGNLPAMASTLGSLASETGVFDAALATMGTEAAIATGGLALVAGAVGYLAYQEFAAEQKARALAAVFEITGRGATMTEDAVKGEMAQLEKMPGVTSSIAEAIVQWEAAHANINNLIDESVNDLAPKFIKAWGDDAPNKLGDLKQAFNDIATGSIPQATDALDKFQEEFGKLAPKEQAHIVALITAGQRTEAWQRLLTDLASRSGESLTDLKTKIADTSAALKQAEDAAAALHAQVNQAGDPQELRVIAVMAGKADEQVKVLTGDLHRLQADAATKAAPIQISDDEVRQNLDKIAQDISKTDTQVLAGQIKYLEGVTKSSRASASEIRNAETELGHLRVQLAKATSDEVVETARATTAALGLTGEQRTRSEIATDLALLKDTRVSAQRKLEIWKDYGSKLSQLHEEQAQGEKAAGREGAQQQRTGAEEAISAAHDASQEILSNDRLNASERGVLAKQVWDLLSSGEKTSADQRAQAAAALAQRIAKEEGLSAEQQKDVEAQISSILIGSARITAQERAQAVKDGASAESEARRKAATETEQIAKLSQQATVDAAKDAFEETSTLEDRKLAYFQETEGEKIVALRDAKQAELQVEIDGYREQLKKLEDSKQTETTLYTQTKNKIEELNRQKNLAIEQSDTQAAQQAVKNWQSIISPIESGMSSMVSSLIGGQTKFGAATRQLLVQVVSDWVSARIKIEFDWLAGVLAKELGDQKWAQKSILEALFAAKTETTIQKGSEAEKTATTAAGTAARDALGATENTGFFGRIVDQVAQWLGLETTKTAETATGTAARVTAAGAETAATIAATKAQAAAEIPAYTGIAAMEAASAVADIPIIGPGLAIAAAEAMNTQGAFEMSLATAEGGMESVDAAEQAVLVHRKESILPARISVPLMSFVGDLPAIAGRVKQNSVPDLRSIADVGELLPVMSPSESVRSSSPSHTPQSDADYVASRVGGGGRMSASPSSAPSKTRGGDIHIHAWDASSMNQFFRKPANRRTMDQISKDRARAGFMPG